MLLLTALNQNKSPCKSIKLSGAGEKSNCLKETLKILKQENVPFIKIGGKVDRKLPLFGCLS